MTQARKLDIFKVLDALNKKDAEFFSTLTDEEKKAFQPFLVARWATGTTDPSQVVLINEFVNPYLFSLTHHKELMWYLLTIASPQRSMRYQWIKAPSHAGSSTPLAVSIIKQWYNYNSADAVEALTLLPKHEVLSMAEQLGWQEDDLKKLRKELGIASEKKSKKV